MYNYVSTRDLRESDANGFVQKAISAANVYNNIVKYIDDANITSLTTHNLSQRAEEVISQKYKAYSRCSNCPQSVALLCVLCFRPSMESTCSSGTWWHRAATSSKSLFLYIQNKMVWGCHRIRKKWFFIVHMSTIQCPFDLYFTSL